MTADLQKVSRDSSQVVARSTYYDLFVEGRTAFGGCSSWSSLLDDVVLSSYKYVPSAITFWSQVDLQDRSSDVTFTCSSKVLMKQVTSFLEHKGNPASAGDVLDFSCGNNTWRFRLSCPSTSAMNFSSPAVCVNCADPCTTTQPTVIRPCTVNYPVLQPMINILSLNFDDIDKPPAMLTRNVLTERTAVEVRVSLDKPGTVYCGIYASSATLPTSLDQIVLQNYGAISVANMSVISIRGLEATTTYRLFCFAQSELSSRTAAATVLGSPQFVVTACCRRISAQVSSTSLVEGNDYVRYLSLSIGGNAPRNPLSIAVVLQEVSPTNSSAVLRTLSPFTPSSFRLTSSFFTSALSSSLSRLTPGSYRMLLNVTGANAADYQMVYAGSSSNFSMTISVVSVATPLPPPALQSAMFSGDGSQLVVTFSGDTNRGGLSTLFTCSSLFRFSCAESSQCVWRSFATVTVFITSRDNCAVPNGLFGLSSSAVIRARCTTEANCASQGTWSRLEQSDIRIAPPAVAVNPAVAITASDVIGSCASLTLDLSSSTGSGGRSWSGVRVTVTSADTSGAIGNTTNLQSFLNSSFALNPPTVIPASLLSPGQIYTFQATLCNFLGSCASASKKVTVLFTLVPTATIVGPSLRTVKRSASLSLQVQASLPSCGGAASSSASLSYYWVVSKDGTPQFSLTSSSRDPSRLLLPPYSLSANTLYEVSVTVSAAGQSTTISSKAFVSVGSIIPVIDKGLNRSVRVGQSMTIDAVGSYDEDVTGGSSNLVFNWACVQTSPSLRDTCSQLFDASNFDRTKTQSVLTLATLDSAASGTADVTLTVRDRSTSRSSSVVVSVSVLPSLAPVISLSSSSATGKVNSMQTLQLGGAISVPAQLSGTVTWSIDAASGVSLPLVTAGLINATFAGFSTQRTLNFFLPLRTHLLPMGLPLVFSLQCSLQDPGSLSSSSISVTVNSPPRPGRFDISPVREVELTVPFTFSCQSWMDDDLPLSYQFGFISSAGSQIVIRSRLVSSFAYSVLPAGSAANDFQVSCFAQVFDALNGYSSIDATVQVLENSNMSGGAVTDYITESLSNATNVDDIKQASAMSTALLNRVDCSQAPNCTERHRQSCVATPNTCGPCISDEYVGDGGDSNTFCVPLASYSFANVTTSEPKMCVSNCSGHGECQYFSSITDMQIDTCLQSDLGCYAQCLCFGDYSGSLCSVTSAELASKRSLRESVVSGLQRLTELEDADEQSILSLISNMRAATQTPDELSYESSQQVMDLALYSLTQLQASSLGSDAASDLLTAIQSSLTATSSSMSRRRRLSGLSAMEEGFEDSIVNKTLYALQQYATFAANSLAPGQDGISTVQNSFRVHVKKFDLSEDDSGSSSSSSNSSFSDSYGNCSRNAIIDMPAKPSETLLGMQADQFSIPLCSSGGTSSSISIAATSLSGDLFADSLNGSLQSNPISLTLSSLPCTSDPCNVEFVMSRQQYVNRSYVPPVPEKLNVTCRRNDMEVKNLQCANGHQMAFMCNGTVGLLQMTCPVTIEYPSCSRLMGYTDSEEGCQVVAQTPDNVTCSCNLAYSARRRLQQTANGTLPQGEISINYVSMLKALTSTFTSTVLSADNLNAGIVARGYRALATLGTFIFVVVAGMLYASYADAQAKKIEPLKKKDGNLLQKSKWIRSLTKAPQKSRVKKSERAGFLDMAQEALPQVLSNRSYVSLIKEELKRHHKWMAVVTHYSDKLPRILRVVSLATNIVVMLFMQSVTYNLTNSDDGSCERLNTEMACLEPSSAYSSSESKCYWTPAAEGIGGECRFVQPDDSITVVLFVAIFSAIVTTPIALLAEYIIFKFLGAPTISGKKVFKGSQQENSGSFKASSIVPSQAELPASSAVVGRRRAVLTGAKAETQEVMELQKVQTEFNLLVKGLKKHMRKLTDEDREEFKCKLQNAFAFLCLNKSNIFLL